MKHLFLNLSVLSHNSNDRESSSKVYIRYFIKSTCIYIYIYIYTRIADLIFSLRERVTFPPSHEKPVTNHNYILYHTSHIILSFLSASFHDRRSRIEINVFISLEKFSTTHKIFPLSFFIAIWTSLSSSLNATLFSCLLIYFSMNKIISFANEGEILYTFFRAFKFPFFSNASSHLIFFTIHKLFHP